MPLTRRRQKAAHQENWHIYYGDVHIGTIAVRAGAPNAVPQWEWSCGFYPGMAPGTQQSGTSATLEDARARFEGAWHLILPTLSDENFQAWRDQRDYTAEKYRRFDRGERMPTDWEPKHR
jgi:hypothetical protein